MDERPGRVNRERAKADSMLYLVVWRAAGVFKVGLTNRSDRLRGFESTGGEVLHVVPHATTRQERAAQEHVGYAFPRAFAAPDEPEAVALLGRRGSGFSECYRVGRFALGAVELALLGHRRAAEV